MWLPRRYTRETNMIRQIASCFRSAFVLGVLAADALCGPLVSADEPNKDKEEETREQQLKDMKRSAAQYIVSSADTPERTFKFHETPALRFSNPVSGTKDGALFLWTNHGRPQAIVKLFTMNNTIYEHVCLSLSENNIVGERNGKLIWGPTEPGIKLREIPDAPKPAETKAERLRQMKTLSAKFSATYEATHLGAKPFELRLLIQPLLQYETDDEYHADGALFCYVQSTAPVGILLLESRQTPGGHRWHYAYASLVRGPLTASYGDKEVFSVERTYAFKDPKQTHVIFHSQPVPKE